MLNGEDLRRAPYVDCEAALQKLLRHGRGIQYVEHAEGHGMLWNRIRFGPVWGQVLTPGPTAIC
jgi:hypothetical protein